jgi:hypothetical protein
MVPEATEKHQGQEFDLPAAVYRRRAWRPAALQGVESVLSSISRRKEPLDRRTARLTAWYEQLARRGQPFTGWSQPLTTEEIGGNNTQPSYDSVQPGSRTALREPEVISEVPSADANVTDTIVRPLAQDQRSATHLPQLPGEPLTPQRPRLLLRSVSGPIHTAAESTPPGEVGNVSDRSATVERPIEGAVEPVVLPGHPTSSGNPVAPSPAAKETPPAAKQTRLAAKDGRVATEKWRRATPMATVPQPHGEQSFVRPTMRLAILRPINTVTDTMLQSESEPISSGSSGFSLLTAEMKDFPALEGLAIGGQPAFQTRLVSSVSPFPRQEVRGGFPTSVKTEIRLDGDISFDGRVAGPASDTSASGNNLSTGQCCPCPCLGSKYAW